LLVTWVWIGRALLVCVERAKPGCFRKQGGAFVFQIWCRVPI
jgi:hypothetical protein